MTNSANSVPKGAFFTETFIIKVIIEVLNIGISAGLGLFAADICIFPKKRMVVNPTLEKGL